MFDNVATNNRYVKVLQGFTKNSNQSLQSNHHLCE